MATVGSERRLTCHETLAVLGALLPVLLLQVRQPRRTDGPVVRLLLVLA